MMSRRWAVLVALLILLGSVDVIAWRVFAESHTEQQNTILYQCTLDFESQTLAEGYKYGVLDAVEAQYQNAYGTFWSMSKIANRTGCGWTWVGPHHISSDPTVGQYELTLTIYGVKEREVHNFGLLYVILLVSMNLTVFTLALHASRNGQAEEAV